jgi:leucine dehydrogenase
VADPFDTLAAAGLPRALFLSDPPSGLRAVIAIDDVTLGPAAGGVRTLPYSSVDAALRDAAALARAMTLKCALGGLAAGGGKAVVMDHAGLDRDRAFEVLGARVEELGGLFRTAGDLGTTRADLQAMARRTSYVHTDEDDLSRAVARGLLRCLEACAERRGREVASLTVAVQGCGAIGGAVARALREAGATILVADVDGARAAELAEEVGARVVEPHRILVADADVLCPCAVGGVVGPDLAASTRASIVCGAANNTLSSPAAAATLHARGVLHVPDVIASAGAVVAGIARTVMGVEDPTTMIDGLGATAAAVLDESERTNTPTPAVAASLARRRIAG